VPGGDAAGQPDGSESAEQPAHGGEVVRPAGIGRVGTAEELDHPGRFW
jgi:hypothetical protein